MKTLKNKIFIICLLLVTVTYAQEFNETIKKELQFDQTTDENFLVVDNVNGPIKVEGYNGSLVKVEAHKSINAYNSRALEQGKKEIGIKIEKIDNTIYVYLDSPYSRFNRETGSFSHNEHNVRRNYKYKIDFTIKVPLTTNIEVKTMNNGNVNVQNIHAKTIVANNLNGAISLDNISGKTHVNALNRDIDISYKTKPMDGSTYKSLNGDINVTVNSDLNADVAFKTLNGGFYTNLSTTNLKPETTLSTYKKRRGTKYKLNSKKQFRIGNGGSKLSFDLLNGDATIKKI